jgi:HAD domain in Swiss Army Knife RNA repair proteins
MDKILFLDIDGVANNINTTQRHMGFIGIDPIMAGRVKRIIRETNCEVVLSSAWRIGADSRDEVRKRVCGFIDITPNNVDGFRGSEINAWLAKHADVTRYAILDDSNDFYPDQPLFKTSWATGLTDTIADDVINYLTAETIND